MLCWLFPLAVTLMCFGVRWFDGSENACNLLGRNDVQLRSHHNHIALQSLPTFPFVMHVYQTLPYSPCFVRPSLTLCIQSCVSEPYLSSHHKTNSLLYLVRVDRPGVCHVSSFLVFVSVTRQQHTLEGEETEEEKEQKKISTYSIGMKRGPVENKTGVLCWRLALSVNGLSATESLS